MFNGISTGPRRAALAQAALAPLAALATGVFAGIDAGLAMLYGVLSALAVSFVLVWRERQTMQHPEWDQHRLYGVFVRASAERLGVLVGLLFIGLGVLKLMPLPLLLGLVLAQFAWLAAAVGRNRT